MIMNDNYKKQVALLIRIMPSIYKIHDFAIHGGTAINLFYKNMPRYSVDIDITYIPIQDRRTSLNNINVHLMYQLAMTLLERNKQGETWIISLSASCMSWRVNSTVNTGKLCSCSKRVMWCIRRLLTTIFTGEIRQAFGGELEPSFCRL
jgi:hypothetical protein